ncbi:MAG: response regulator transcription factor [Clostridia bacterium]|nr:response regulator transcription factor [Clostridia bacterium]MBR3552602.1 response regulator transcription factor [Clostridia bacterium]
MNIALLDDEAYENENLCAMIKAYAIKRNFDIHCETFTDGRDLLKKDRFDLYFLDFRMEAMDGIEVAQALKEKYSHAVTICYLTNYAAAAAEIINRRIYADGFLQKPVKAALLEEKLDQFYSLSFFQRFELRRGANRQTVYAQDILYVEADDKRVKLHLFDRVESYNYLLREIEKILQSGGVFYRISRSFLVNMQYVDRYDAKSVTMKNGEVLPLKDKNFQQAYHDYMFLLNN